MITMKIIRYGLKQIEEWTMRVLYRGINGFTTEYGCQM